MVLLTFDDFNDNSNYHGFNFNNFTHSTDYTKGLLSKNNYSETYDIPSITSIDDNLFKLSSGYFISALSDDIKLYVNGYNKDNNELYSLEYTLSFKPILITFDWLNLHKVTFTSDQQFITNNLNISYYMENTTYYNNKNSEITTNIQRADFKSVICSGNNLVYGNQILPDDFLITGVADDIFKPKYFNNIINYICIACNDYCDETNLNNGDIIISVFLDKLCTNQITTYPNIDFKNLFITISCYNKINLLNIYNNSTQKFENYSIDLYPNSNEQIIEFDSDTNFTEIDNDVSQIFKNTKEIIKIVDNKIVNSVGNSLYYNFENEVSLSIKSMYLLNNYYILFAIDGNNIGYKFKFKLIN